MHFSGSSCFRFCGLVSGIVSVGLGYCFSTLKKALAGLMSIATQKDLILP